MKIFRFNFTAGYARMDVMLEDRVLVLSECLCFQQRRVKCVKYIQSDSFGCHVGFATGYSWEFRETKNSNFITSYSSCCELIGALAAT